MDKLRSFFSTVKVQKGEKSCTHTTKSTGEKANGWRSGSYYIENSKTDQFMTIYCNAVSSMLSSVNDNVLTVTEKPGVFSPLRIDFDFKQDLDADVERKYTPEIISKIVGYYQEEIRAIQQTDTFEKKSLWCIVLEKRSPRVENGFVKDGFHLHFPFFIVDKWTQDVYLRDKITSRMITEELWNDVGYKTKVSDMIDTNMAMKPWLMFGSCNYKNQFSSPYLIIQDKENPENNLGYAINHKLWTIPLETFFADEMVGKKSSVKYYLPRFLSVRGHKTPTQLSEPFIARKMKATKNTTQRKASITQKRPLEDVLTDIKTIKDGDIMSMLSDSRAESYDSWMDVGWTLFSITQGHEEGLDMWIEFSKKSANYKDGECEDLWNKMEVKGKTMGSLLRMAKNDSPAEYSEYKTFNVMQHARNALFESEPTEYDICNIIWTLWGDTYVCSDAKSDTWYRYISHRYDIMDEAIPLRKKLPTEIRAVFEKVKNEIIAKDTELQARQEVAPPGSSERFHIEADRKTLDIKKKRCARIMTFLKKEAPVKKIIV